MSETNYQRCVEYLHMLHLYLERMATMELLPGETEPEGDLARQLKDLVEVAAARTKKARGE